jgi:hypothetical protein
MSPKDLLKRKSLLIATGCVVLVILVVIGTREFQIRYARSHAATSYETVLAEIQQATSTQAIYALAEEAGLTVTSSTAQDGSTVDNVTSILITDPTSGAVLATVREYDDLLSAPSSTSSMNPPPAPLNILLGPATTSAVQFSWSEWPAGGVVGYNIYRNGKLIGNSSSTSFIDNGLSPSGQYIYGVAAYDANGNTSAVVTTTAWTDNPVGALSSTLPQVQGLKASVSGNSVNLSWQAPNPIGNVEGYILYRSVSSGGCNSGGGVSGEIYNSVLSGGWWSSSNSYGSLATQYSDGAADGLTTPLPSGTYYYCVAASSDGSHRGSLSAQAEATVTNSYLPVPAASLTKVTSSSISFSLYSVYPNVQYAGYKIYRQLYQQNYGYTGSQQFLAQISQSPGATSTTFTDTGLSVLGMGGGDTPGQLSYTYFVSGYNAAGETSPMSVNPKGEVATNGMVLEANPVADMPSQAQGLTASVSGSSVMLTWEGAMGAVYDIFRANASGACTTLASLSVEDAATRLSAPLIHGGSGAGYIGSSIGGYFVDNPDPGTYYYCVVSAMGNTAAISDITGTEIAYGPVSQEISATVLSPTAPPPAAPTNLTITGISSSTISLSWAAAVDSNGTVAGYQVYRDGTQIAKITGTDFTDSGLTAYVPHTYAVAAYDTAGNTSLESWNVSAMAAPLPSEVQGLSATSTNGAVQLSWQPAAAQGNNNSIYGYLLYGGTSSPCSAQSPLIAETSTLSWAGANLSSGTYYYCVLAQDWYGTLSPMSAQVGVTVQASTTKILQPKKICPVSGCNEPKPIKNPILLTPTSTPISTVTSSSLPAVKKLPPSVALINSPISTAPGKTFTLVWSTQNVTSCVASGAWSGAKGLSGTVTETSVATSSGSMIYTLTCSGPNGTASTTVKEFITSPVGISTPGVSYAAGILSGLFTPSLACAQTSGGGSTVEGNNTGQFAVCSIAGSNGTANIFVGQGGEITGINGNYQFDVVDQGGDGDPNFMAALNADGVAGDNGIQALGGPSVLANPNGNLITLVINEDPTANQIAATAGDDGIALFISTQQPDGTYQNGCAASLFVSNTVKNTSNIPGINMGIFIENEAAHEIGHCLGLAHTNDPKNVMYGGGLDGTSAINTLLTFNPAQIQYLQDVRAGKTIQVDPDSCEQVCKTGKGFVMAISSEQCVSETTLCGNQPGTVWYAPSQTCMSCPAGSYADQTLGQCILNSECTPTSTNYDSNTGTCGNSVPEEQCGIDSEGVNQCTYASTGVTCNCDAGYNTSGNQTGGGFVRCSDSSGNAVDTPAGACEGSCQSGQIDLNNNGTDCVPDCDQDINNPACNLCTGGLTQLPDGSCVTAACAADPSDPSCPDPCTIDPGAPGCQNYCANNPQDSECGGGDDNSNIAKMSKMVVSQTSTVLSKPTLIQGILNDMGNFFKSL